MISYPSAFFSRGLARLAYRYTTGQLGPRIGRGERLTQMKLVASLWNIVSPFSSSSLMVEIGMLLRLLQTGAGLWVSHLSIWSAEHLQTKKIPLATFVSSPDIELVRYDLHHQISPLSLLTWSLDSLGIVQPLELLFVSTPIFVDCLNRFSIYWARYR